MAATLVAKRAVASLKSWLGMAFETSVHSNASKVMATSPTKSVARWTSVTKDA